MAEIGQAAPTLIARPWFVRAPTRGDSFACLFALLAVALAAALALWLWPFTVDDALISIRYARHIALGAGYRFNVGGPSTDGVTPLPWPFLLWPLAHGAPLVVLWRAKALGLAMWLAVAGAWGFAVGRCEASIETKALALAGLGVCVPLAAHGVSGMETASATALATTAALLHRRPGVAAVLAGLAASLRPEMVPWALVLATSFGVGEDSPSGKRVALLALVALLPFVACSAVRLAVFGRPAPLALLAKPGDLAHGVVYAAAAALASVGFVMACAPFAAARKRGAGGTIVLAGGAHLVAVALVGGDWMPYARLVAPVVPSMLYASVLLASHGNPSRIWVERARAGVAIALGFRVLILAGPLGRHVGPDREALVRQVTPLLAGRERVASVDIGWLSAATEADIVDLAGVTDPEVAALGGGHTSKRIDAAFLLAKRPGALLLFADASELPLERWQEATFPRVVEARLARSELLAMHFTPAAFVPLGATDGTSAADGTSPALPERGRDSRPRRGQHQGEGYYVLLAKEGPY
jgi:hypothetical protein